MKNLYTLLLLVCLAANSTAQTSSRDALFTVVQQKCASCHTGSGASGNLDLGTTPAAMYAALYMKTPTNTAAAQRGDKLIYAGRPDRSFFFRKANHVAAFETSAPALSASEGNLMPNYGGTGQPFRVEEKELLRQWILYGAPSTGAVIDTQTIYNYYNVNGKASFPNGAPAPPPASEGFQVKMGPFFMNPGGEVELYKKHELVMPANVEVDRIETLFSEYSHHFIGYKYNTIANANAAPHGIRTNANYTNTTMIEAVQEPTDLRLPTGTAFFWANNTVLDLDSHYINYSQTQTYLAESYLNIYTKPSGTAHQEMRTTLIPNQSISIPADQNPHTFNQTVNYALGNVYLWSLMGHTHKYGNDFKVYKRNANGTKGTMLYDAQCERGEPGCFMPNYDYRHIPMRYFLPFEPIAIQSNAGFISTATYTNTGTQAVAWGETSNDEMMVTIAMMVFDTTGVVQGTGSISSIINDVKVYPNPAQDFAQIVLPDNTGRITFTLSDVMGREITREITEDTAILVARNNLPKGVYFYHIIAADGRRKSGKILFE